MNYEIQQLDEMAEKIQLLAGEWVVLVAEGDGVSASALAETLVELSAELLGISKNLQ
jgi:hypothetical protein